MPEILPATKTVLICEDNDVERIGLRVVLRRHGFATTEAENAIQGILKVRALRPDVVLLDMLMPDGDGWAFLELIRTTPDLAGTPVLIVTGMEVASPEWAESLGAQGLLRKPVSGDELVAAVDRFCA